MSFNLSYEAYDLNSAITKANAAAPQSTTYTKTEVNTITGDKSNLNTTNKTNLVAAINEINTTIGNINTVLEEVL